MTDERLASATGGLDPAPPNPGAIALAYAPAALLLVCAVYAAVLRRRGTHGRVAVLLGGTFAAWIVQTAIAALLEDGPYVGLSRAFFHLDQGTRLATTALLAWAVVSFFARPFFASRAVRVAPFAVAAAVWIVLVVGYPEIRGDRLRLVYLAAELLALLVCVATVVAWLLRSGGREVRSLSARVLLVLIVGDAALLAVGAWPLGLFGEAYALQQAGLCALYLVVALMHVTEETGGGGPPS